MSNAVVKSEKRSGANTAEERDLEEWAKRLVQRPTPQIGTQGLGQQGTLNSFLIAQNNSEALVSQNNGFDYSSAIQKFTWHTIAGDKYIPCIFRDGEKYCSVKMAEISTIGDLLRNLPSDLYDSISIHSHNITPCEARLLNQINSWHCDGFYGSEQYTTKDCIISIKDLERFYKFLSFAYSVLTTGGRNDSKKYSKCAFIKVNSDNLIPYTVLPNGEKGVPLFYFEGQTDILKEKAVPLTGWELAYLKICCKVQGVRKDLILGSTLQIVKVSDLRAYFPRRTIFSEECWPEPKQKSLLSSKVNGVNSNGYVSGLIPPSDKWIINSQYKDYVPPPPTTPVVANNQPTVPNPLSITQATSVISVKTNNTNNNSNGGSSSAMAVRVSNTAQAIPTTLQAKAEGLRRIKVLTPPVNSPGTPRLQPIPELSEGLNRDGVCAYAVRLIIIDKELMHCINMNAFKSDTYLVVFQEFMSHFFPSISIYPTAVSVLKSCGVTTYLPNQAQIRILNSFGFNIQHPWQIPLIQAVAATQSMGKLKNLFRPREAATSAILHNSSRSNGYAALTSTNASR